MCVDILARNDDDPPERVRLHEVINDLRKRGYRWGDIAVLASRNDQVIKATSWLNEKGAPFISYSSLDVRRRKAAGEILALLAFLDSPRDDLSFATFILGDIFAAALAGTAGFPGPARLHGFLRDFRDRRPLYKAFQLEFPEVWKRLFAGVFRSAGYLPLYDLASEIYVVFDVFQKKAGEEATLVKLLEAIKDFESRGANSLRDFLRFAGAGHAEGAWDIDVPKGADSINVMTVHKAKGLGFPVVIALLYGERNRGFSYTVTRENGQLGLVKLTRQLSRGDEELSALYDRELLRDKVNKLNGLYVALTRAREEMYVIGVRRERDAFPFELLPESGYAEGNAGPARTSGAPHAPPPPLSHAARPVAPSVGARRLTHGERRRGELVHAALARIVYASPEPEAEVRAAMARAARAMRMDGDEAANLSLARAAGLLISKAPLAELFFGRRVGRCSRNGRCAAPKERFTAWTAWSWTRIASRSSTGRPVRRRTRQKSTRSSWRTTPPSSALSIPGGRSARSWPPWTAARRGSWRERGPAPRGHRPHPARRLGAQPRRERPFGLPGGVSGQTAGAFPEKDPCANAKDELCPAARPVHG